MVGVSVHVHGVRSMNEVGKKVGGGGRGATPKYRAIRGRRNPETAPAERWSND